MSQVFISYKSEEESWATRIAETLTAFGISVWRDHAAGNGIRISYEWKPEIQAAIGESTTMVVLWSKKLETDANSVAHQEINNMKQLIERNKSHRFISVLLDDAAVDRHPVLGAYQAEDSLKDLYAKAGPAGAWSISDPEWYSAMLRILALFGVDKVVQVRYAVGAMTREQAEQLRDDPKTWAQDENAWLAFQAVRNMTAEFDPDAYGETPDDWKPFPYVDKLAGVSISEIISRYDRARRKYEQDSDKRPNWALVSYSEGLLSEDTAVRAEAREALKKKCIVILDPVSLLHKTVYQNVVASWGLQGRENAFVIGLSACEYLLHSDFQRTMPNLAGRMKNLLDAAYDRFGKPFEPENHCVLEIGNHDQFARWVQVAGDRIIAAEESPFRFGTMSPAARKGVRSTTPSGPGAKLVVMGGQGGR